MHVLRSGTWCSPWLPLLSRFASDRLAPGHQRHREPRSSPTPAVDLTVSGPGAAASALVIGPPPLDLRSPHVTRDDPENRRGAVTKVAIDRDQSHVAQRQ